MSSLGIGKNVTSNGSQTKPHNCNVIDLTKSPYVSFGHGYSPKNPKKCIVCRKPIKKGEAWRKYTSEDDPEFGRYSFIVHSYCY